jgi:hypothetical protein
MNTFQEPEDQSLSKKVIFISGIRCFVETKVSSGTLAVVVSTAQTPKKFTAKIEP